MMLLRILPGTSPDMCVSIKSLPVSTVPIRPTLPHPAKIDTLR